MLDSLFVEHMQNRVILSAEANNVSDSGGKDNNKTPSQIHTQRTAKL